MTRTRPTTSGTTCSTILRPTAADRVSLRQELEFKIEAMIHILDLMDGDSDFEPYLAGISNDLADTDDREDESEILEHSDEDTACDDFPVDDDELDADRRIWGSGRSNGLRRA